VPYVRRLKHEGESLVIGGLIRLTFRKKDGKRHVVIDAPPGVKITATGDLAEELDDEDQGTES